MVPQLSKVIALLSVLGRAQAAAQVCADPSQYKPDASVPTPDGAVGCAAVVAMYVGESFTASEATCTAMVDNPTSTTTPKEKMNILGPFAYMKSPCCSGTPTVCDAYMFNPCKTPSTFDATRTWGLSSDSQSCMDIHQAAKPFTESATTCSAMATKYGQSRRLDSHEADEDDKPQSNAMVAGMGAGCCTDGVPLCDAFVMKNICATESDFTASTAPADLGGMTCAQMAGQWNKFTPSVATCSAKATEIGEGTDSRSAMLGVYAVRFGCCGKGMSVCAPFSLNAGVCKDTSKFTPDVKPAAWGGSIGCEDQLGMMASFYANTATCAGMNDKGDATMTVEMGQIAAACCSDGVSVCTDPPAPTTTTQAVVVSKAVVVSSASVALGCVLLQMWS